MFRRRGHRVLDRCRSVRPTRPVAVLACLAAPAELELSVPVRLRGVVTTLRPALCLDPPSPGVGADRRLPICGYM